MSETPHTHVGESDPNADGAEGLAGDMGVSSERRGTVRGGDEEVTYATAPTYDEGRDGDDGAAPDEDAPPEQSAGAHRPEVHPDPVETKDFDSDRNPRHGV